MLRSPVGAKNIVEPVVSASQPPPSTTAPENKNIMNKTITVRKSIGEIEARIGSPQLERPKYASKLAEARACVQKVKLQLGASRNTKKEIVSEVIGAVERLYQLVKESQGTPKPVGGAEKEKDKEKAKDKAGEDESARDSTNDDLVLILKQNNRLLQESMNEGMKEMMRKMEELRKGMEENGKVMNVNKERMERMCASMENTTTVAKASYASVVSRGVSEGLPETRALHSVVVSSKDEQETGDEVMEKIRKTVDAKDGWVKVERVRKVKNRRVVVGCMNEEERNKVKERLSKNEGLVVEEVKNKNPLLAFRDVMKCDTADFITAFNNQNAAILEGLKGEERKVEVAYVTRARNPLQNHVVVRASPQVWKRCVEGKYAHIGLGRVRVWDHSPLVQCSRCLGFGHTKRLCKEEMDRCSHCAGPHLRTDCEKWLRREAPQCINCTKAKKGSVEHSAFDRECVERKRWDALARSAVAYC